MPYKLDVDNLEFVEDGRLVQILDSTTTAGILYVGRALAGYGDNAGKALPVWEIWIINSNGDKLFANGIAEMMQFVWNLKDTYTYK